MSTNETPLRLSFALSNPTSNEDGSYEILAITSGLGNGWKFSPSTLQKSLSLWDGVHCFLDHSLNQRSIKDIAGILTNPVFDEDTQGIRATLTPFGPGANLLTSIAPILTNAQTDFKVGFSADLSFIGTAQTVKEIVKVHSVDLVVNPARGGKFLRVMNNENKGEYMEEEETKEMTEDRRLETGFNSEPHSNSRSQAQDRQARSFPNGTHAVAKEAQDDTVKKQPVPVLNLSLSSLTPDPDQMTNQLRSELEQATALRRQLSIVTLNQMLEASKLPKASAEHVKRQFAERDFTMDQVQSTIAEQHQLLSALTASESIHSPGRIESTFNETERLQAAVQDLFGIPREPEQVNLKVPRLTGIRELYLALTGDTELHGGYHPERIQLATTADFTGLVKNALNKIMVNTWEELGRAGYDWWKDVTVQEHFNSLHDITGTLIGTVGDLPSVAEGGTYTELLVGDSPETAAFTKYGGYIPLTLELIDRDETRKLRAYARELASAGMRKISRLVANIFTANAGAGPLMADGGNLFNVDLVTTATGHANLSTVALSAANWDSISSKVYKQPMLIKNAATIYGTGPQMAVNPKFLLVARANQKTAMEICTGSFVKEASYVYDNVLKGSAVPMVVPDWTDNNDWAAVCDPRIAPAIFIGERFGITPEIFVAGDELSPAVFTNDEHRLKVRHFLAVWVNDFRPLHKSNVV